MWWLIRIAIVVLVLASAWKLHAKAGQPGWVGLVPIVNLFGLLKMAGKPYWWILLLCIPLVNVVAWFLVASSVAKSFGKGFGYTLGLTFFTPLFVFLLGFGEARYMGPARS